VKTRNPILLTCILVTAVLAVVLPGCGAKQAETGDTVKVHYTAKLVNGEAVDTSINREPLEITLGEGQVIAGFEQAILGMKVGENKTVTVPADQAYGAYREDMIMEVSKSELPEDLALEVGMELRATQPDGTVLIFTIKDIADTKVTVDANHPLAGEDLTFDIELIEIAAKAGNGPSLTSMTLSEALSSGRVTLAEFGSDTCAPCRQMKPILEDLAVIYEGKANIILIDVYDNMELTRQYEIMGIPTQILFDIYGREITRHTGYWAKEDIIAQLKEMGID